MRPRRASDAALVRKCCSSGDEITASRDAGGQGACTSCSADCQMLRLKVAGCRRGQPELPGAARPACASEGAPVPLQHSPCLPSPCKCQPQKPRPGWRPCRWKTGWGGGRGEPPALSSHSNRAGVLVSGGHRDRCRRHGLSAGSGGQRSEVEVPPGWVPCRGCGDGALPCVSFPLCTLCPNVPVARTVTGTQTQPHSLAPSPLSRSGHTRRCSIIRMWGGHLSPSQMGSFCGLVGPPFPAHIP